MVANDFYSASKIKALTGFAPAFPGRKPGFLTTRRQRQIPFNNELALLSRKTLVSVLKSKRLQYIISCPMNKKRETQLKPKNHATAGYLAFKNLSF
jgi:hypothetical protein